jgi:hypothetical protein
MSMETKANVSSGDSIDQLERELARCALQFRASPEGSHERTAAVNRYQHVLARLCQIEGWCGTPDLDSQLPDQYMPTLYKERPSGNGQGRDGV